MVIRTQTDIGGGYGLIQLRQAALGFLRQASKFFKHVQPVFGLDLDEAEPSAHREIKGVDGSIDVVHRADDIDIVRHIQLMTVLGGHIAGRAAITRVDGEEQLAEYLGDFTSVDLVDDEHEGFPKNLFGCS